MKSKENSVYKNTNVFIKLQMQQSTMKSFTAYYKSHTLTLIMKSKQNSVYKNTNVYIKLQMQQSTMK